MVCFLTAAIMLQASESAFSQAASSTKEVGARPNLVSIHRATTAPHPDGVIQKDEYPTRCAGLIDCATQSLYPQENEWDFAYDDERLYFAFRLKIPADCKLTPCGAFRDDSTLIAAANAFYLFLRPDKDVAQKAFNGAYLGVSSTGLFYDAWESIDWVQSDCKRDTAFNADWKVAANLRDDVWTLELSVPWKDLKLPAPETGMTYALSFGMNLDKQRL